MSSRLSKYKYVLNSLNSEQEKKLEFICELTSTHTTIGINDMLSKYGIRRLFAIPKYKNYKSFVEDELFQAIRKLTEIDLEIQWREIYLELKDIQEDLNKGKESSSDFFGWTVDKNDKVYGVFMSAITNSGLITEYLEQMFDHANVTPGMYDPADLPQLDKVIDFMARFGFAVLLLRQIQHKSYNSVPKKLEIVQNKKGKLTFHGLFRREFRDSIPDEVIRLLGPGEADAWEEENKKKKWIYEGPESAIMIPFFYLVEMNFIEIPPRGNKDFISVWLNEFGIEYKPKTFDKPPKDYKSKEFFLFYIEKLLKTAKPSS